MKLSPLPFAAAAAFAVILCGQAKAKTYGSDFSENYCREYSRTITIDGEKQKAYGKACQQPDGSWEIVSEPDEDYDDYDNAADDVYAVREKTVIVERPVYYYPRPRTYIGFGYMGHHHRHGHKHWHHSRHGGHRHHDRHGRHH